MAALSAWHEAHAAAADAIASVRALPAHVMVEAYSVLTRLPGGLAVPAATAADVLIHRFDEPPLRRADDDQNALPAVLAGAGVLGGATYDGLVGLEAAAHGRVLLTLDRRAQDAYRRLGVSFRVIGG